MASGTTLRSSRQPKEKRRGGSSSMEELEGRQAHQKRPRLDQPTDSSVPAAPPIQIKSPSRVHKNPTKSNKQRALNSSASNEGAEAAFPANSQARTTPGNLREGMASARQVHARLQAPPSAGALNEDTEQAAEPQKSASASVLQGPAHSRSSAADKGSRDERVRQGGSGSAHASAGSKVTVFSNPLLQKSTLLGGGVKDRRK